MASLTKVLSFIALLSAVASGQECKPIEAIAIINRSGDQVSGNITFRQNSCGGNVEIQVHINGLAPGKHGFHIHEKGDLSNGCLSTGAHYNPTKLDHGGPMSEIRHVGDLGNIEADSNGVVSKTLKDSLISLSGLKSIIGRAVVIHTGEDDLGLGQVPDSKKTGNAGGRIGCGIIGIK